MEFLCAECRDRDDVADCHARESLHINGRRSLCRHVLNEKDTRYDTRFTPCMTLACPRALNPPEPCPKYDGVYAACERFNNNLTQQPDVVCAYCDRRFHSRNKYCLPITLATEARARTSTR